MIHNKLLTPEQFARVKVLFGQAEELAVDAREAFLDEACFDEPDIRGEVERLLGQRTGADVLHRIRAAAVSALSRQPELVLTPGQSLGDYEVLAPLGVGGMGEVYRARDSKLGREVAVKVMAGAPSIESDRYPRFEREARLLASLNHPNIATLHGLEHSGGVPFLVMELVEGETLAERIDRGRVSLNEALAVFRQIAEAMEVANGKGILHRDLKPANIKLTPDGKVKVLDFSLATTFGGEDEGSSERPGDRQKENTADGIILGTAAYMSPEQARGGTLDRRADTWAFGCCLYETLTGRRPFEGRTVSETLAAVVTAEPDFDRLPSDTPTSVRRLLRRCLEKEPQRRLRDFGDALLELEENEPAEVWRSRWRFVSLVAALGLAVAAWALARFSARVSPSPVTRLSITLPSGVLLPASTGPLLAISPDGRRLAVTADRDGVRQIFTRSFDTDRLTAVRGTERGSNATFSPDGSELVFRRDYQMHRIPVGGGTGVPLAPGDWDYVSWGLDDKIYYRSFEFALTRVPARGGESEVLLDRDSDALGGGLVRPEVLPNGVGVLFSLWRGDPGNSRIEVLSLETGRRHTLIEGGTMPKYSASGHVLYALDNTLFAAPFDAERLELLGPGVPVVEDLQIEPAGATHYDVSDTGTLVYARTRAFTKSRLVLVDRAGRERPFGGERGNLVLPRLSPDGRRISMERRDRGSHIWLYDQERDVFSRMTSRGSNSLAVWNRTGGKLAYRSWQTDAWKVFVATLGEGPDHELVKETRRLLTPEAWLPDSSGLLLTYQTERGDSDIVLCRLGGEAELQPIVATRAEELQPALSPEGRFLAYMSDGTGTRHVWVAAFPEMHPKVQISTDGGTEPVWSRDGHELFYRDGNRMMAVAFGGSGELEAGKPELLFEGDYLTDTREAVSTNYDVTPDGEFLMLVRDENHEARIEVVLNWHEELRERVPAR